jgi:hypothetical protein
MSCSLSWNAVTPGSHDTAEEMRMPNPHDSIGMHKTLCRRSDSTGTDAESVIGDRIAIAIELTKVKK